MPPLKDLTGMTFGRWTVLRPEKGRMHLCRCECGTEKLIQSGSLQTGKSQSCGCLNRDAHVARRKDITGRVFGRWTVLSFAGSDDGALWLCRCACGAEKIIRATQLAAGLTKSCGCLRDDVAKVFHLKHGRSRNRGAHGADRRGRSRAYRAWGDMLQRCSNPNFRQFKDYGGRGITVCEEWKNSFENFLRDMGEPPEGLSLDRIDNDGGYSADNCRWATRAQQQQNRRQKAATPANLSISRSFEDLQIGRKTFVREVITVNGRTMTIEEWAARLRVPVTVVRRMISLMPDKTITPADRAAD